MDMAVNAGNLKQVMEERCGYYEGKMEELRGLIGEDGPGVERLRARRESLLQGLAVDLGRDFSMVARAGLQCAGSPYWKGVLDSFGWYLKDCRDCLRLFSAAESGGRVG